MFQKNVETILNRQVEREMFSSNLYLSMASWSEQNGFDGISKWLYAQADEERLHLLKIVGYINERGGKAIIPAVEAPAVEFENPKMMFAKVLTHEEFISNSINEIVAVCFVEKDFTTYQWIQWFVSEQIQEEKSVRTILDKLNLIGENNLYVFDRDIFALRTAAETATA